MTLNQIPLKVFNILPRTYEVVDMIISSKDTNGLRINYEETTKTIPSLAKDKTMIDNIFPLKSVLPEHILKKFFLMINTFSALLLVIIPQRRKKPCLLS
jgi:hypothetical protein